ncbi:hypothetical protein [Eggerthella sinensis]|uniref:hypothetical protein n=1 Tax=Eggerthella sinensis TaxID=242230 RepID=UPI0022E8B9F5|nr:hypothetical protein [Eggerthella sinensis]
MAPASEAARTNSLLALTGAFLPSFLGLAATRVWLQVNLFASYTQSDDGLFTIVNNLAYGLVMVIGAAIALHKPFSKSGRTAVAWLGFAVMTFSTVLILAGKETGAVEILAVASVCAGIGGALGGGMWTAATCGWDCAKPCCTGSCRWRSGRSAGSHSASCPRRSATR